MTTYHTEAVVELHPGTDQSQFDAALDMIYAAVAADTRISALDMSSCGTSEIGFLFTATRDDDTKPDGLLTVDLLREAFSAAPDLPWKSADLNPAPQRSWELAYA